MFSFLKTNKKITLQKPLVPHRYKFNVNPQKYEYCQSYLARLTTFFDIESKYNSSYHYIAINEDDGKLYEIHTRIVGFEGAYKHTKAVLDFVFPPREINIEEFLELVDSLYPKLSFLYDGINENNLYLYQELMKDLYTQKNIVEQKPTDIENRKYITIFNQSDYENRRFLSEKSEIYPLLNISQSLLDKGFVFEKASVGGGITEISHTGSLAYSASYSQFEKFRDGFHEDIKTAQAKAENEYKGWATIDYRYIFVDLHKGDLKIRIETNDNVNETVRFEWYKANNSHKLLIKDTNQKMISILGEGVQIKEYYYMR